MTDLHQAAADGDTHRIRALKKAGVNLSAKNEHGETALHVACWNGHLTAAHQLAVSGVVNLNEAGYESRTPLHCAATRGWLKIVEMLLAKDAYVMVQDDRGLTPLHHAALHGCVSVARALLKAGANPSALTPSGVSPLDCALSIEMAALLRGAIKSAA